jgi:hypothetical protein
MNDTVSGVLAGVGPKGTAPGTAAGLIPGITRTTVSGPDEALATVAANETATAPTASAAKRRKRTDVNMRVDRAKANTLDASRFMIIRPLVI